MLFKIYYYMHYSNSQGLQKITTLEEYGKYHFALGLSVWRLYLKFMSACTPNSF